MSTSLKFLIFADGSSNLSDWRPNKDDSAWWLRRDALVRCISASAYSGASCYIHQNVDSSIITVKPCAREDEESRVPSEVRLLRRIKEAIRQDGILAGSTDSQAVSFTHWKPQQPTSTFTTNQLAIEPTNNKLHNKNHSKFNQPTKRDMVRTLQNNCDLEFLRKWNLNSKEDVVLKKISTSKLANACKEWSNSSSSESDPSSSSPAATHYTPLTQILKSLRPNSIVLILHEDSPNTLPIFTSPPSSDAPDFDVLCVMGGVKDATNEELALIHTSCDDLCIQRRNCNLGRSAQFTSKIISSLVGHMKCRVLASAARKLVDETVDDKDVRLRPVREAGFTWDGKSGGKKRRREETPFVDTSVNDTDTDTFVPFTPPPIHYILRAEISSTSVTTDLSLRDQCQPLTSSIVNCLWKSCSNAEKQSKEKERGSKIAVAESDTLTLCFTDMKVIKLDGSFVRDLAERHMAAPTELHVLKVLVEKIEGEVGMKEWKEGGEEVNEGEGDVALQMITGDNGESSSSLFDKIYAGGDGSPTDLQRIFVSVGFEDEIPSIIGEEGRKLMTHKVFVNPREGGCSSNCLFSLAHSWVWGGRIYGLMEKRKMKKKKKKKKKKKEDEVNPRD